MTQAVPIPGAIRRFAMAASIVGAAAAVATAPAPAGAAPPRCFGAASRDRVHPCENPRLRRRVTPTPDGALITPDPTPCTPVDAPGTACAFGTPPDQATAVVALVGDSHADHWRAGLDAPARALGWSVIEVTHSSCPYTEAVPVAPKPVAQGCVDWNAAVRRWLGDHPEIGAVITSNHPGPVEKAPGQSTMSAWVQGIHAAWNDTPASVEHILVIRDIPFIKSHTLPCVKRAIRHHRRAGSACALERSQALHHDPYEVAAERLGSGRAQVVDLTHFFCGARRCYPVVGGALVFKDFFDHLTSAYAATLGPYLLRGFERAMTTWGPA